MNAEARLQVHQVLLSRRQAIAEHWYNAIARTSCVPFEAVEVRRRLVELTEEVIALLLTEPFEPRRAEAIGASLAGLHYVEPEALGKTLELLGQQLLEGLTADQIVELQPRLAALISGLATGFARQARETILAEQEWIHGAFARALRRANEVLRAEIIERKQAEDRIRSYQERLRALTSQLSLAEERERRRLALALHDDIAQTLALSKIKLGIAQQSVSSTDLAQSLGEIQRLIEFAIQATRSLTLEISPPIVYELGLVAAVDWLTRHTQTQHGIPSEFWDDKQPKPLDEDVRVLLYQAVRELLINVVKHAQAQRVRVSMRRDDTRIRIAVEDNGVGFDTSDISSPWSKAEGFGLFNIRERLDTIGGHLEIESQPGNGTRVTLVAPLSGEHKARISRQ